MWGINTLPSVNMTVFSHGNLHGRSPQGPRSTTSSVTRTQNTRKILWFLLWHMFTLISTVTIQIYNTLEGVTTAPGQTCCHLLIENLYLNCPKLRGHTNFVSFYSNCQNGAPLLARILLHFRNKTLFPMYQNISISRN